MLHDVFGQSEPALPRHLSVNENEIKVRAAFLETLEDLDGHSVTLDNCRPHVPTLDHFAQNPCVLRSIFHDQNIEIRETGDSRE